MTGGWVIAKANVDYFQQIMFNYAESFLVFLWFLGFQCLKKNNLSSLHLPNHTWNLKWLFGWIYSLRGNLLNFWLFTTFSVKFVNLHKNYKGFKLEITLFVFSKLTFSEYLWCLNFPPVITKQVEKSNLFWNNLF